MKQLLYRRVYVPALVLILKIFLAGFDWVLPEAMTEDAYEVLSDYLGKQYALPARTEWVMQHLNVCDQAIVFDIAWELRQQAKRVDAAVEKVKAPTSESV